MRLTLDNRCRIKICEIFNIFDRELVNYVYAARTCPQVQLASSVTLVNKISLNHCYNNKVKVIYHINVILAQQILTYPMSLALYVRYLFVYKIPYRRAPRLAYRPLGRVRRASKGILHTRYLYSRDALGQACATIGYLVYNHLHCYVNLFMIKLYN